MDEATFKERVKRLNEINKVVEKLDPAIREQAFALLSAKKPSGTDRFCGTRVTQL